MELRKLIESKLPSYDLEGEVEADESYFGGLRKGKRHLRRFNGIKKDSFYWFLKECGGVTISV